MRRFARAALAALALALLPAFALAAPAGPKASVSKISGVGGEPATLRAYNRTILEMRATLLGYPPAERVSRAESVIRELLAQAGPGEVAVRTIQEGRAITLDGKLAFLVLEGDANALTGETLDQAASRAAAALRQVVEETREARSFDALGRSLVAVGIATAILAAVL